MQHKAYHPEHAVIGSTTPLEISANHAVNGHSIREIPENMQIAYFAMGCFWGVERLFWQQPGVYSTSAGYSGGVTENPTYEQVCQGRTGHAEVVRVYLIRPLSAINNYWLFFGRIMTLPKVCAKVMILVANIARPFIP